MGVVQLSCAKWKSPKPESRGSRAPLPGVVKNHTESIAAPKAYPAGAVTHVHTVNAALSLHRSVLHRKDRAVTPGLRDDFRSRLHAWTLLGEQELASGEVIAGSRQKKDSLHREDMLAIQILVQAVAIAPAVLQQQRRRSILACPMAAPPPGRVSNRMLSGTRPRGTGGSSSTWRMRIAPGSRKPILNKALHAAAGGVTYQPSGP